MEVSELQQQIKIAENKEQHEKVAKLLQRVSLIKTGGARKKKPESVSSSVPDSGYSSDTDEKKTDKNQSDRNKGGNIFATQKNSMTVYIAAGEVVSILACLKPRSKKPGISGSPAKRGEHKEPEKATGRLLVYEVKNVEITKVISWEATLCQDQLAYVSMKLAAPHLFVRPGTPGSDFPDFASPDPSPLRIMPNPRALPLPLGHRQQEGQKWLQESETPPNSPREPKEGDEVPSGVQRRQKVFSKSTLEPES